MTPTEFVGRLERVAGSGDGWTSLCPGHADKSPSLSINEGEDGRILIHCHAGCTPAQVCAAVGISERDLFQNLEATPTPKLPKTITATYDYTDESGKLLFQVVRYHPKTFKQRKPDTASVDGWSWSVKGVRRVPFHLPELIKAVADNRLIYIAEGEKDVLALEKAGFAATCNAGGAGKWSSDFAQFFNGAEVVIVADKDGAGRKHAKDVEQKLRGTAASVKIIECPDINEKPVKDASDFFEAGGQAAELDEIAQAETVQQPVLDDPWFKFVSDAFDIVAKDLPPIVEVVQGIVAEKSKLVIATGSKMFKTWTAADLTLSVSHGVPFLNRETARRRVLYCNFELKERTFERRLQQIAGAKGITVEREWFHHLPLRGRIAGVQLSSLISRIIAFAQHFKASVVVCDPVYKMNPGDENSSRDQTVFFNELDRICTEGESTLILLDHAGKGDQSPKDPLDVIRGSSAKGGDLDAAMILRRHEVDDCFRVDLIHRELPPVAPFVLEWKFPLMRVVSELNPEAMKKPGVKRKHSPEKLLSDIIGHTKENPISISAWAERSEIIRQTLCTYLPGMRAKGLISTAGEGNSARQYLTPQGQLAAAKWIEDHTCK